MPPVGSGRDAADAGNVVDHEARAQRILPPGAVVASVVSSVVVFVVLSALAVLAMRRAAESEARRDAATVGAVSARVALAPYLTDGLLTGDPAAVDAIEAAGLGLIRHGGVLHVKVWGADGRVVWSENPALIGRYYTLDPDEVGVVLDGGITSEVSDLQRDENEFERVAGVDRLLEVYLGTRTSSGAPAIVETYTPYEVVTRRAGELQRNFLPYLIAGMGLIALAQVPVTLAAARRISRYQSERERLLQRVIDASDAERRRIAAEVHDGAVQDLAGVTFALAGAAALAPAPLDGQLRSMAADARGIVRSLRSLLTSVYPVEVPPTGWVDGLSDLVDQLEERGVVVTVDVPHQRFAPADEVLFLRVAREALRNAVAHAAAGTVTLRLERRAGHLVLEVLDDGMGFALDDLARKPGEGHVGLRLLHDLATDVGADLTIESRPGAGTAVRLDLPSASI